MLDVVQKDCRCLVANAGEENGGPRNRSRSMFRRCYRLDEFFQRDIVMGGLFAQQAGTLGPGPHDNHDPERERHGNPAAIMNLQKVRAKEDRFKQEKRHEDGCGGERRPAPDGTQELEGHQGRHHHRAGDGDSIGSRQRFGIAEGEDQDDDADKQQHVHGRNIDLARIRLGGEGDLQAWQEAEVHRLARKGKGSGDDSLAGNDGGHGRQDDDGQQRPVVKPDVGLFGVDLFMLAAVFQSIAFAVHLQYVDMMGQPVEKSACEAFGTEGLCPFIEWQV